MGFQFSLAAVLRLKQAVEKQEELALQKILAEIAQVHHQIERLAADVTRARRLLDQAMQQLVSAADIESTTRQIAGAMQHKQELMNSLAELHRRRETQTRKYQAAHNSRKMLSDMETRQRDAYGQERARIDQKFLDDIFVSRSQRS